MTEKNSLPTQTLNVTKMNETQKWNESNRDFSFVTISTYAIAPITILGLFGNATIFWFLCCRIKRTKYTVYVLNLAIADFTVLFSYNIFWVFSFILWDIFDFNQIFWIVLDILSIFGCSTSFFILTAISVERCLGAFYPICYHFNRPKHLSTILCALLWVFSCVVTGIEYFTCWLHVDTNDDPAYKMFPATTIFLTMVFLLFSPIMVLCSVSMFIKIRRNSRPSSQSRLYLIIVITVVLFLFFALPHKFMCLFIYWYPATEVEWIVFHYSVCLHLINSSVDPFVYFLVGRRRRRQRTRETLYKVLYRSCKDQEEGPVPENLGNEQEES